MKNPNYVMRFEHRIKKLECQLTLAQDINFEFSKEISHVKHQYDLAMKRIDYLESVIQKLHAITSEKLLKEILHET